MQTLRGGGQAGWRRRRRGGNLLRNTNVPSKAFCESVEHERDTSSLRARP
jgi:hypothetical protein